MEQTGREERPVERAAALYEHMKCARTFREDLEAHLLHGYVISTPEVFALVRAVWSGAPPEEIRNPWFVFAAAQCDAWLVYLFAGDVKASLPFFPSALRYVGWERAGKNGLRFLPLEKILKRCARSSSPKAQR